MELHPSEAKQAVFGQAEAVTKLRDQEHSLKQRVDSLKGQEERANARIRTKEQESQRLTKVCQELEKTAKNMSNKGRQGSAPKPSGSKSMPPKSEVDKPNNGKSEVASLTKADLDNMMEKVQETATRIAQDAVRKQAALSAPASDKKHRFSIYEEVVFFNELLLGNFWTFPLGRAFIIVKLTLEDDDTPTYSIRDRDVNHIIDGVDQCFLSTKKEF